MIVNGKRIAVSRKHPAQPHVTVLEARRPPVGVGGAQAVGVGDNGEAVAAAGAISAGVLAIGIIANLALIGGLVYIGYRAGKASCERAAA